MSDEPVSTTSSARRSVLSRLVAVPRGLLCLAALLFIKRADANGRFPRADQVVVDPADAGHIVIRTTYGLAQSRNAGKTWQWVCETSVLGREAQDDPMVGITADGSVLVAGQSRMSVNHDYGCSWGAASELDDQYIVDLSVNRHHPHHTVVIGAPFASDGTTRSRVFQSEDDGVSWNAKGVLLPGDLYPVTIDDAPSDFRRVFVTGFSLEPGTGILMRSDDLGENWKRSNIELGAAHAVWIGGVDPSDPDRLWVRLDGRGSGGDLLLRSDDAGESWTEVYSAKGSLLGFAVSPDGHAIAFGGPDDGVFVAPARGGAAGQVNSLGVRCLAWETSGLYACAREREDGFTLGRSTDEGTSFQALYHMSELCPLECPAQTSTAALCPNQWPTTRAAIGSHDVACTLAPESVDYPDAAVTEQTKISTGGSCSVALRNCRDGRSRAALWFFAAVVMSALRARTATKNDAGDRLTRRARAGRGAMTNAGVCRNPYAVHARPRSRHRSPGDDNASGGGR